MVKDWIELSWKVLLLRGAVGIVFGIVAMAWPLSTAIALALLWGVWALLDGVGNLAEAFGAGRSGGARAFSAVLAVIALIAAFFAIASPAVAAATLTWILGVWLIVRGGFEVLGAVAATRRTPRSLLLVGAALDILLGVLFVANPGRSALAIAFVLGLVAFAWGVVFVATGLVLRSQLRRLPARVAAS